MNLTLVISSLGAGGAERVMSILANWWAQPPAPIPIPASPLPPLTPLPPPITAVTLITLSDTSADFYPLHPSVRRVALDLLRPSRTPLHGLLANIGRVRTLRRAIRDSAPDAVISFMDVTNILTLLATRRLPIPVLISERVDPRRYPIGRFWSTLRRHLYPRASALVVQTAPLRPWAEHLLPPDRVFVIPNPVEERSAWSVERSVGEGSALAPSPQPTAPSSPLNAQRSRLTAPNAERSRLTAPNAERSTLNAQRCCLALGRLTHQKGFDQLLRAFARCVEEGEGSGWSLTILGEGEARGELERLAESLGIAGRVSMPGRVPDPEAWMSRAELFVLSSRYEGFPNALVEAMAAGLPVISTNCPTGPADIIRPGVDGVLVPSDDPDALAGAMRELMRDPDLRARLAAGAPQVRARFATARIAALWEHAIAAVSPK